MRIIDGNVILDEHTIFLSRGMNVSILKVAALYLIRLVIVIFGMRL